MSYNTNTTGSAAVATSVTRISTVTGSFASPIVITAVGGVTPAGYGSEIMFIKSNGGQYLITANPQIAAGTTIGQTLLLIGASDADAIVFSEGNGVFAGNAAATPIMAHWVLGLTWTGLVWANITNASVVDTDP